MHLIYFVNVLCDPFTEQNLRKLFILLQFIFQLTCLLKADVQLLFESRHASRPAFKFAQPACFQVFFALSDREYYVEREREHSIHFHKNVNTFNASLNKRQWPPRLLAKGV